jgi:L,D-transpeptidase catalytic domain
MRVIVTCLIAAFLTGCTSKADHWAMDMNKKMQIYGPKAKEKLEPYFAEVHVHYPPKKIALLAFKDTNQLQLWGADDDTWHYIKTYPILAASGHLGPKLSSGDYQVPEGVYHIKGFNPDSRFTLSMQINYPNEFDKEQAQKEGRSNLGDNIFIHGKSSSIGCLAIGDEPIEELFVLARLVGQNNIDVIISPKDFQHHPLLLSDESPSWLGILYQKISLALRPFQHKENLQAVSASRLT